MESVIKQSGQSAGSPGSQPPLWEFTVSSKNGLNARRDQLTVSCFKKVMLASFLILGKTTQRHLFMTHVHFYVFLYSYFENGCRKTWTRQSRKVLWVVLRSLFFIEILKEWHERPWTMFPSAKAKQQK